jgi:hypothetical protein
MRAAQDIAAQSLAGITYAARPDATPEAESSAVAAVFKFALACQSRKEATSPGSPDDGTKVKEDSANENHSR